YRSRCATQAKTSVMSRRPSRTGEARGATDSATRGPSATMVSCALTSGGWTVASMVRAVRASLLPGRTASVGLLMRPTLQTPLRNQHAESSGVADYYRLDIFTVQAVCNTCTERARPRARRRGSDIEVVLRSKNTTGGRLIAACGWLPASVGLIVLLALGQAVQAQSPTALVPDPFRALVLPTPNELRTGSGRPGPRYWQQQVNYKISATLDPAKNELRGHENIHYVNRSPYALPYLWLFVEQTICAQN